MNSERMLAGMDREIEDARRRLEQLTTARNQYTAAHGVVGRRSAPEVAPAGDGPKQGSLVTALLRVMADGEFQHVDAVLAALAREGRATTKGTVTTALARGAGEGGPFERRGRGTYRIRPAVVQQWVGGAKQTAA